MQLTATGGTAPYKWKLTGGALPKSIKVHPTGLVSGTVKGGKHPDSCWDVHLHGVVLHSQVQEGPPGNDHLGHVHHHGELAEPHIN